MCLKWLHLEAFSIKRMQWIHWITIKTLRLVYLNITLKQLIIKAFKHFLALIKRLKITKNKKNKIWRYFSARVDYQTTLVYKTLTIRMIMTFRQLDPQLLLVENPLLLLEEKLLEDRRQVVPSWQIMRVKLRYLEFTSMRLL